MTMYAAFFRGINVGGHRPTRMADVVRALESLGFKNVKTLLASGNVLFEAPRASRNTLVSQINARFAKTCGHDIHTIVRTMEELREFTATEPFKGIRVTPQTRLFVTLLSKKPTTRLKIPYVSPDKSFRILCASDSEVCSVLTVGPQWAKNLRQMNILEKEFGKDVTTRSWSTIVRVVKAGA